MTGASLAGAIRHLVDSLDRLATAIDEAADDISDRTRRRQAARGAELVRARPGGTPSARLIRSWAAERGVEVKPTGRIPYGVIAQYLEETESDRAG